MTDEQMLERMARLMFPHPDHVDEGDLKGTCKDLQAALRELVEIEGANPTHTRDPEGDYGTVLAARDNLVDTVIAITELEL